MSALVIGVFLASVVGSLHCVGMCGAFLALAFSDADSSAPRWRLSVGYHGGRLVTYVLLGVAAGTLGSLLDLAGTLAGVSRVALPLAGVTVAGFGLVTLLRHHGWLSSRLRPPAALARLVHGLQGLAMTLTPGRRALAIGLLTTLLPCGWLYAFAVTAAGTASALVGAVVMAVFWAGTLPALVSCGLGVQHLAGPLGRRLPTVTCVLLILLGLWTLTGRSRLDPMRLAALASAQTQAAAGTSNETKTDEMFVAPVPACCLPESDEAQAAP